MRCEQTSGDGGVLGRVFAQESAERVAGLVPPLVVVDAARQRSFELDPPRLRRRLRALWAGMHAELARLSGDSVHVTALRSDDDVSAQVGHPNVVIRAVQAVVRAARDSSRLAPCARIFSGSGVRCRS